MQIKQRQILVEEPKKDPGVLCGNISMKFSNESFRLEKLLYEY